MQLVLALVAGAAGSLLAGRMSGDGVFWFILIVAMLWIFGVTYDIIQRRNDRDATERRRLKVPTACANTSCQKPFPLGDLRCLEKDGGHYLLCPNDLWWRVGRKCDDHNP